MAPGILLPQDTVMADAPSSEDSGSESPAPAVEGAQESSAPEPKKKTLDDMFDDDDDDEEDQILSSLMPTDEGYLA